MRRYTTYLVLVLLLITCSILSANDGIIVNLRIPENPWSDIRLGEKLDIYISSITHVPLARNNIEDPIYADIGGESFNDLIARGQLQNGHYLVDIKVDRIDLEKRKSTIIPELFWRYRIYAVLEGTIRVVDIPRERMVRSERIEYDVKAAGNWQLVDDNKDAPSLSIPADELALLFNRLEEKAAFELYKEIKDISRGNNFGK